MAQGSPTAVAAAFACAGVSSAASLSRMPSIRDHIGATSAELGLALVAVGIGSMLTMPWTGRLTERFSSAKVLLGFALLTVVGWTVIPHLPGPVSLGVVLLFVGAGFGVWDVAMNVQGHLVETRQQRVLMPMWHAVFSFGAVAGSAIGAGFAKAGVSVDVQFPLVGLVVIAVLAWSTSRFVDDHAEGHAHDVDDAATGRQGLTGIELLLGLIMFCTALGEGAANDWLGLMLVDTREVPESFGAMALAGFNLTMGVGRIVGAGFISRFGRVAVLRASGLIAFVGVGLLCLVDSPVIALIGAAGWGLGLAVVFPSCVSAAGEIPGRGARAIAAVSTIGYSGFLLGAPSIGQLTRAVALDRALLVVAAAAALIVILAGAARSRARSNALSASA